MTSDSSRDAKSAAADLRVVANDISYIRDDIKDIKLSISTSLVTQDQFSNVKSRVGQLEKVVYGFIGLVLLAVVGAMVSGVIVR